MFKINVFWVSFYKEIVKKLKCIYITTNFLFISIIHFKSNYIEYYILNHSSIIVFFQLKITIKNQVTLMLKKIIKINIFLPYVDISTIYDFI